MREIDALAHLNRWRNRTVETMVLSIGLLVCAMVRSSHEATLLVCLTVVASLSRAGVPFDAFLRAVRVPLAFLVLGAAPLCVSVSLHGARPVFDVSPVGVDVAIRTASRSIASLSATLLLAFTTPFPRIAQVLCRLRFPSALVELLGLVYRSIFSLDEFFRASRRALAARGGFRHRAAVSRSLPLLASGVFGRSLSRSLRLAVALESRLSRDELEVLLPQLRPDPLRLACAASVPAVLFVLARFLEALHA